LRKRQTNIIEQRIAVATSKPHLVLIPGLLCTDRLFAPQIAALGASANISVADHTGFASLPEIARAILADAPERFALAGLSMGGYIAFEMLRQAPERVMRLALLDTNARADRPEQADQRRKLIALAERDGIANVIKLLLPYWVHKDRLADQALVAILRGMAEAVGVAAFKRQQEAIMGRPDNRPFLAQIQCPTVIVVGAEDAVTPVKVSEEMHAGIAGSRLEVIPDCGHLSTLEQPEAVNAALARWLVS
jgi:pimeloyl-ACP methyl ester carboxylesterase